MARSLAARTLRCLREEAGFSRSKVAADLGISERTLIRHEMGTTPLSRFHRSTYASYFAVDESVFDTKAAAA